MDNRSSLSISLVDILGMNPTETDLSPPKQWYYLTPEALPERMLLVTVKNSLNSSKKIN